MSLFDTIGEKAASLFHGVSDSLWGGAPQIAGQVAGASGEHTPATHGLGSAIHAPAGALEESAAAADAARARAELADRFVVDDDPSRAHENNVVTSKEMGQVARIYSDLRLGRGDLRFDLGQNENMDPADNGRNRDLAMADVASILQTSSGRELLGALSNNRKGMEHHTTSLAFMFNPDGAKTHGDSVSHAADAQVHYRPGMNVASPLDTQWGPMRSDVALYHELVHAYHFTHHDSDLRDEHLLPPEQMPIDDLLHPPRNPLAMEQQAVGNGAHKDDGFSENVYRAERRAIGAADLPGERTTDGISDDSMIIHRNRYATTPDIAGHHGVE